MSKERFFLLNLKKNQIFSRFFLEVWFYWWNILRDIAIIDALKWKWISKYLNLSPVYAITNVKKNNKSMWVHVLYMMYTMFFFLRSFIRCQKYDVSWSVNWLEGVREWNKKNIDSIENKGVLVAIWEKEHCWCLKTVSAQNGKNNIFHIISNAISSKPIIIQDLSKWYKELQIELHIHCWGIKGSVLFWFVFRMWIVLNWAELKKMFLRWSRTAWAALQHWHRKLFFNSYQLGTHV